MVEPLPGNRDVWEILCIASNQWRAGFGGAYGLDYTAIIAIAQALGIETDCNFFEKIHLLEAEILNLVGTRSAVSQQKCDKAQKEKCSIEFGEHLGWACKNCNEKH